MEEGERKGGPISGKAGKRGFFGFGVSSWLGVHLTNEGVDEDVASSNTMSHVVGCNQRRDGNSIPGDGLSLDASHKILKWKEIEKV